jgi:hypothetical protein
MIPGKNGSGDAGAARSRAKKRKPNGAAPVLLDRAAILDAEDLTTERVAMPEWGGDVLVRALPLADVGEFEAVSGDEDASNVEVMTRMVALCACDADGNRLFTLDDATALARKARGPMMRLATAAMRVNALTAGDVEELAKN